MKIDSLFSRPVGIFVRLLSFGSVALYALFLFGSVAFSLLLVTLLALTAARGLFM